jgi:hypothetical protein
MLGVIVGGQLDLAGFERATIVAAALLIGGGVVSFLGIRDVREPEPANLSREPEPGTSA